jgi:DNA-binding CsgD family transcriptional regulator
VPAGIREPTLERIARLPAPARRLAEAAAVVQVPADISVLSEMTGLEQADETVDDALRSGLLAEHGSRVAFRHLLAAKSVYDDLSSARRVELHRQAADALRTLDPVPLGQVAHHLRSAGRLEEWAQVAEQAAARAIELGNDEEARRLLDDVLRTVPLEPDRRGRLANDLGRAAIETAQAHTVVDLLTEVVCEVSGPRRGALRITLAGALNQVGDDIETQVGLLVGAAEDLVDRPELRAEALTGAAVLAPSSVPHEVVLERFQQAMALAAEVADPVLEGWVLSKVGAALCTHGLPGWREPAERVLALTGGSPRLRREVRALWTLAVSACWAGHLELAAQLLGGCRAAPATQESERLELTIRAAEALLAYCRGSWDDLAAEVAELSGKLSGALAEVGLDVHVVDACLALAEGRTDDGTRKLAEVLDAAERLDDLLILPTALAMSARTALARGDTEAVLGRVRAFLVRLQETDNLAPIGRLLPAAAELLVEAGLADELRAVVGWAERAGVALDAPLVPAAVRHARGVLDGDAAELIAAAELYDGLPAPYEAAQARETAAVLSLPGEAGATLLRTAVRAYEQLGANGDRRRAAGLARRHGIGLPAVHRGGHRGYGQELSPREREVAGLAAAGRTNNEIAAELYVSKNTVEKHLGSAMRKLKVRSRTELASRWDAPA